MSFSFSFTKSEDMRAEQVLSWGLVPEGVRRRWGKSEDGEYDGNTMYSCMKMEKTC
jgi:hypothetical protein